MNKQDLINFEYKQEEDKPNIFLDKIFEDLKKERSNFKYQDIKIGAKFQGYKTIQIQKLEERKRFSKNQMNSRKFLWQKDLVTKVYCYQESCKLTQQSQNGFFKAFYQAYINHGDILITPDDLWAAIMLFFSKYIDRNSQQLRQAFVTHNGKKQLTVTTDLNQYQWDSFFNKMIIEIKKNTVENVTQNLQSNFSTTNRFFNIFSTAIIMNSYKKYFDYTRMMCICGIQNIHMGGTEQDWIKLNQKLLYLQQFDVDGYLKLYIKRLKPVLQQFLETYRGNANLKFWNNIYHQRQNPFQMAYQPKKYINGWIIRFFTLEEQLTDKIPIQQIDVPIKVVNDVTKQVKNMNLVGGCRGISIQNNVFRPHYSFAIVHKRKDEQKQFY